MSVVNCEHVYHTQETEEQLCFARKIATKYSILTYPLHC